MEEAAVFSDGQWRENAAKFETSVPLGYVLALELEEEDTVVLR